MAPPTMLARDDLRAVARYQRAVLICVLVYLVLAVSSILPLHDVARLAIGLSVPPLLIVAAVFVFLLSVKLFGTGVGVVLALLTLIPCVGLIALLIINQRATAVLRTHGVRVGLMGANAADVERYAGDDGPSARWR